MSSRDSMFYRFFKAKFFPHGTIFDSKENTGSLAWKDILKGHDVVRKGMKLRIGNGSFVRIYQDCWLLDSLHGGVLSALGDYNPEAMVSNLIDQESHCWRDSTIDRFFQPHVTNAIKAIMLTPSNQKDTIFWPRNHDGVFLVKSRYHLLLEEDSVNTLSSSKNSVMKVCAQVPAMSVFLVRSTPWPRVNQVEGINGVTT